MSKIINNFVFDVDGTLTPSRREIDKDFKEWFKNFCISNPVYLISGSDRPKTIEQVGEDLYNRCKRVYNCAGNDVWEKDKNIHTNDWVLPDNAHRWLDQKLTESKFPLRTGNHFETRPGLLNFSVVGRNATMDERKLYVEFDQKENERNNITFEFNKLFKDEEYQDKDFTGDVRILGITATAGGETGIDIYPTGKDKSQIMQDFGENDKIFFFGDRMDKDGNDYTLAQKVHFAKSVTGWQQTKECLCYLQEAGIAR